MVERAGLFGWPRLMASELWCLVGSEAAQPRCGFNPRRNDSFSSARFCASRDASWLLLAAAPVNAKRCGMGRAGLSPRIEAPSPVALVGSRSRYPLRYRSLRTPGIVLQGRLLMSQGATAAPHFTARVVYKNESGTKGRDGHVAHDSE